MWHINGDGDGVRSRTMHAGRDSGRSTGTKKKDLHKKSSEKSWDMHAGRGIAAEG